MNQLQEAMKRAGLVTDREVERAEFWKRRIRTACVEAEVALRMRPTDSEGLKKHAAVIESLEQESVIDHARMKRGKQ